MHDAIIVCRRNKILPGKNLYARREIEIVARVNGNKIL